MKDNRVQNIRDTNNKLVLKKLSLEQYDKNKYRWQSYEHEVIMPIGRHVNNI